MKIISTSELNLKQKNSIYQLWNKEYPSQLAYKNLEALDIYLNNLKNPKHYFTEILNEIIGWAFAFERENETWFAIIVDSHFQNKKIGTALLQALQKDFDELNGWVIDHQNYLRLNGKPYPSPLGFYQRSSFDIFNGTRLEIPILSAVKITWKKL